MPYDLLYNDGRKLDMKARSQETYNFHVPLPRELYRRLRQEAEQAQRPATAIVREAVQQWLKNREREALHQAMADYVARMAGTAADLDEDFEAAAIALWLAEDAGT